MNEKPTLLLVDDEPMALDILEGHLITEGYHLVFAHNGLEVIDKIADINPDVILTDVMMPEMSGFELCEKLKSDPRWQHIPIILVTALGGKDDLARGLDAGADDFIHKPVFGLELQARVRSMLRIKKQYDDLQATANLRDEMAHLLVHDMRTPLTIITGYCEWLLNSEAIPTVHLEDIKKIRGQALYLNAFLHDMLIMAKMESSQLVLNYAVVDVKGLIQAVVDSHGIIAQSKQIELVADVAALLEPVQLDSSLFQRVLDNLISNAIKFSPSESKVSVQAESLRTEPGLTSSEPTLRVAVLDEGPGIPIDQREQIFDKFEIVKLQARSNTQIGLGLAFCKMVTNAHGGRIFVKPNEPVGSIFVLEI